MIMKNVLHYGKVGIYILFIGRNKLKDYFL
jgi:hypothetical protein